LPSLETTALALMVAFPSVRVVRECVEPDECAGGEAPAPKSRTAGPPITDFDSRESLSKRDQSH